MGRRGRRGVCAVALAACVCGVTALPAVASSLPSVASGHRPGPDILYAPPARAPQLENTGVWKADPILVSGASAYRDGEYLYQDFLYDDHGANTGARDPGDKFYNQQTFARPDGSYSYPTAAAYASNAADLVELRVKPLAGATAFRITLNSLSDPSLVATTIAIGGTPGVDLPFPYGANASAPADLFLTVHGTSADLRAAATGKVVDAGVPVAVDAGRRQIEVRVPHADWNPGTRTVRLAAGVGLWDAAAGRYLLPQPGSADAQHPGGGGATPNPCAFFNVAFRHAEPAPNPAQLATTELETATWWRDEQQGEALRTGDLSSFHDDVDFAKLAAGANDDMTGRPQGVPRSGPMDRILASRFSSGQGVDFGTLCGTTTCKGELRGQLQPYAIYVPPGRPPRGGWGLTLLLHSLSSNYNQFLSVRNQAQFGQRGRGSIVITPEGRGPDGWYYDWAGADTFEVWSDVARRLPLDPAHTVIAGYSMGGYATWKFATQYPDLFAAGQPTVGPTVLGTEYLGTSPPTAGESTNTIHQLASLRNVPFLIWVASSDEIVPTAGTLPNAQAMDTLGYRYEYDAFAPAEHLTLAIDDQFAPAASFLDDARVKLDPAHVTYAYNPTMDFAADGTAAGHAYWISRLRLRDTSGDPPIGTIDARSSGFGRGDPAPAATTATAGMLPPGNLGVLAYAGRAKSWGPPPRTRVADRLDVTATNLAAATVDPRRARIDCAATVHVKSDGPFTLTLAGCGRRVRTRGSAG
jgi:pimeloyl-ACP methyl ester carboxylesterase